ncbi:hypothetical protein AAG570_012848, partial [Ranatra chinensis]
GRPSPQVSWWVGGELVDSSDEAVSERKVRNTLETNPVGRHLHGLPVTCRAVNNRILQPLSTTVNLKLYREYKSDHIRGVQNRKKFNSTKHISPHKTKTTRNKQTIQTNP